MTDEEREALERQAVMGEMEEEDNLLTHTMPDGTLMDDAEMEGLLPSEDIEPSDNPMEPDIEDGEGVEQREAIMSIGESILRSRSEAVEFRAMSGIERWWKISEQLLDYNGDLDMPAAMIDYAADTVPVPSTSGVKRSRVIMNLVRGRCEVSLGRFEDILLPVREKNWGYKNTPVSDLRKMVGDNRLATANGQPVMGDNGKQATHDELARKIKAEAEKAMKGMELEVHDALTECGFNSEERQVMENAVQLGTGILKGPCASRKLKKVWKKAQSAGLEEGLPPVDVRVLEFHEDNKPISVSVSPWNVYPAPDCKGDPSKASYIWEKDTIRPRDVQRLVGIPGYSEKQLELVLQEQPRRMMVAYDEHGNYMKVQIENANLGELYELWEYNGEVKPEYMEYLGCKCPTGKPVSARIVFINDHIVKATLNLIDTGDLPYDFFPWTSIPEIPWGAGEPIKIMWAQRIINAAWRQMMDNSGDSSGANLAIVGLEPDDGVWELTGKKLWRHDGVTDIDDVRKMITQVQLDNNQAPLQAVLELALKFIDLMTATPTIFQGEAKEAPDTLGATNIIVDSSNVTFRSKVKRWDDCITTPHLRRWYDYMMQYHEDDTIKGDFDVDPRGASVLYEKDQMRQQLLQIFQLKQDPDIARKTDWDKAIELFYASSHLDILKESDGQQQAPANPQQQQQNAALQIAQIRVEGDLKKEQMKEAAMEKEMQFKAMEAEKERVHDQAMKEMDMNIKMMEYSEKRNIELDKLKAQLAISAQGMNMQWTLSKKADIKEERDRQAVPEVSTPPTEPAGKAPTGESYQR